MFKRVLILVVGLLVISQSALANNGFWSHHKVLFIFSSQCPHCQKMGPVMKQWIDNSGVPFEGVSIDGQGLPSIAQFSYPSQDLMQAAFPNGQIVYPASFILNTDNYQLFAIGLGAMDYQTLNARVNTLMPKIISYEGARHAV